MSSDNEVDSVPEGQGGELQSVEQDEDELSGEDDLAMQVGDKIVNSIILSISSTLNNALLIG